MSALEFMTIGAVASAVGMPRWKLAYLIERGEVPGPSVQVPGRRLFTAADLERIRQTLCSAGLMMIGSQAPPS